MGNIKTSRKCFFAGLRKQKEELTGFLRAKLVYQKQTAFIFRRW